MRKGIKDNPVISPLGSDRWYLVEDYHEVPAGYVTDGASVPRFLWRVLGPPVAADTVGAAIRHDYAYATGRVSRAEADNELYLHLRVAGVGVPRAFAYWLGVRLFGWMHYGCY